MWLDYIPHMVAVLSILSVPVTYVWKELKMLRAELNTKITEEEVRQLLKDKLEPIREDVVQLNTKLDKIIDHLLQK